MLLDTLRIFFDRDLQKLETELELYKEESKIWSIENNIANSAGNLCLHVIGNLNSHIGAQIGKTNYIRNRELEFSSKNIDRSELLVKIEETRKVVDNSLSKLTEDDLKAENSILASTEKTSIEYLLVHLTTHLAYHLGQINYHRRLIDEK